jgi:RsiW-degrading membrane proteinase PrsW (M82 family)
MMGFAALVFCSFIAGLIYSSIIYATVPYKIIDIKVAIGYLLGGSVAIFAVLEVHDTFPWWLSLGDTITEYLFDYTWVYDLFNLQITYFIQVGFLEEVMKVSVFLLYGLLRSEAGDHPVATMFYMMMVSLGFGMVENYLYAINSVGSDFPHPFQVLSIRSFTATLGHMTFGLISGFWIALGRLPANTYTRSWFDVVIKKRPLTRKWVYLSIGLLGAIIFHGIYNFNSAVFGAQSIGIIYIQLIIGLLAGGWCFKYLNDSYNKSKKKSHNRLKVSEE